MTFSTSLFLLHKSVGTVAISDENIELMWNKIDMNNKGYLSFEDVAKVLTLSGIDSHHPKKGEPGYPKSAHADPKTRDAAIAKMFSVIPCTPAITSLDTCKVFTRQCTRTLCTYYLHSSIEFCARSS